MHSTTLHAFGSAPEAIWLYNLRPRAARALIPQRDFVSMLGAPFVSARSNFKGRAPRALRSPPSPFNPTPTHFWKGSDSMKRLYTHAIGYRLCFLVREASARSRLKCLSHSQLFLTKPGGGGGLGEVGERSEGTSPRHVCEATRKGPR